jgi:hypothetical protein
MIQFLGFTNTIDSIDHAASYILLVQEDHSGSIALATKPYPVMPYYLGPLRMCSSALKFTEYYF